MTEEEQIHEVNVETPPSAGPSFSPAPSARKSKRGKKLIRVAAILLVVVLIGGGFLWWHSKNIKPAVAQDNLREFTVTRGNVTQTVSGPGSVSPVKIFTIATNLTGDIAEDYFQEGDQVEKDALMFQLDQATTSLNFDSVQDSLSNAQDSYQSALRSKQDLSTYAKQGGLISTLYVKKGDQVNTGARVADVIDIDSLLVTLPFNSTDAEHIQAGDAAQIFVDGYDQTLSGQVRRVASGQSTSASGAVVTNVEIVFANPGALNPGGYATAVVGDYACNNEGMTEYATQDTIYAAGSGKITDLPVKEGDTVQAGQRILTVENTSVDDTLSRSSKSVTDAEKKLTNTQNNLQIKSPIAGTVLAKYAKAGDTLYNTSTALAVVADMSCLTFTIDVDELDIRYVQVGQKATITADAFEGETFEGEVTNVGKTGTSSNGVTTYPVTIEIQDYGDLLPGMNVNADIVVREATDALYIPVEAVARGNMVLVKENGTGSDQGQGNQQHVNGNNADQGQGGQTPQGGNQGGNAGQGNQQRVNGNNGGQGQGGQTPQGGNQGGNANGASNAGFVGAPPPAGYVYRKVETGISDSNYVEIVSGLQEGDVIAYRVAATATSNQNFNMMMGPGGGTRMYTTGGGGGGNGNGSGAQRVQNVAPRGN